MKRELPMLILVVCGLFMLLSFYFKVPALSAVETNLYSWSINTGAFAGLVGIVSLTGLHWKHVVRKDSNSFYSAVLLLVMWSVLLYGLVATHQAPFYRKLYSALYEPVGSTTLALLAYYITSAALRAFVAKSSESAIMLVAGIVVMLGQVPIGAVIWEKIPVISEWVMSVPSTAGARGLLIASSIGGISMGLRVILGMERRQFGLGEGQ